MKRDLTPEELEIVPTVKEVLAKNVGKKLETKAIAQAVLGCDTPADKYFQARVLIVLQTLVKDPANGLSFEPSGNHKPGQWVVSEAQKSAKVVKAEKPTEKKAEKKAAPAKAEKPVKAVKAKKPAKSAKAEKPAKAVKEKAAKSVEVKDNKKEAAELIDQIQGLINKLLTLV